MFGKSHIQIGAGRYYQHHGAIELIGAEAAYHGKRIFVLYSDDIVYEKTCNKINVSLDQAGVVFKNMVFGGPSTERSFEYIAEQLRGFNADVIIGVGGGRIIDIAKGASDMADIRVITVPTSTATCAAYAILYVVYGEDGSVARSSFLQREISAVIVDLDLVINDCPERFLASGIADAMAKNPEFLFTMQNLGDQGRLATSDIALRIADYTYNQYLENAGQAMVNKRNKNSSALLENIVCMNIMLTGLISDLSTGGKQLAIDSGYSIIDQWVSHGLHIFSCRN